MRLTLGADVSLIPHANSNGCECVKIANTPDWRAILLLCTGICNRDRAPSRFELVDIGTCRLDPPSRTDAAEGRKIDSSYW
jgi:hypothetical protein